MGVGFVLKAEVPVSQRRCGCQNREFYVEERNLEKREKEKRKGMEAACVSGASGRK